MASPSSVRVRQEQAEGLFFFFLTLFPRTSSNERTTPGSCWRYSRVAATYWPVLFIVRSQRKACEMSSSRPRSGRFMGRCLQGGPTARFGENRTLEKEGEKDEEGGRGCRRGGSLDAAGVENVFSICRTIKSEGAFRS